VKVQMATIKAWSGDNDQLRLEKQQENDATILVHLHRQMMPNQQMHCLVCCKRFCLKALLLLLQVNERAKPLLLMLHREVHVSKAVHCCEILKMRGVGVEVEASSSTVFFCCWDWWEVEGILFLFVLFQVQGIQCEGVDVLMMSSVRKRKWGANEHRPKK